MTRKPLLSLLAILAMASGCDRMRGGGDQDKDKDKAGGGTAASAPASSSATASTGGGAGGGGGNTILVGEYGSMTGSEATFGKSTHNGIMLAVKEINAAGGVKGKKIEIKSYDDQGKSQEVGTAVTRLITDDHVTALLGEVASSRSIAGGRVAQQYGVPMITPSSTNATVTQIGDMISRVCFIDSFQGYAMAKFAKDNLKAGKVALLYDQSQAYSKGLKDDFKKAYEGMGGKIASEQAFNGGDQDFSAQLTTIRDTKPDALYVPGYYTDVGNVAVQARKLGIKVPLLGGDGWDSAQLAAIGGDSIEGSYYSNHYSHQEQRPEVQEFVKKYKAEFGETPDGLAALGYDAARLLSEAMGRAPSLSGKDIAAAIAATKDFHGVTGIITIDPNRNARKPAVILQMKGGTPTYVATIQPSES
jgi:branched-chain amino acid transport system substrate-binding protein